MFIKKSSFADEIAEAMQQEMLKSAVEKETARENKLVKAAELLYEAATILDDGGFNVQAEVTVSLLESLAGKKKKKTKKKELTSKDMEKNYKEKGWPFNETKDTDKDKNSANDMDQNCAACGALKVDRGFANEEPIEDDEEFQRLINKLENAPNNEDFEDEEDWDLDLENDVRINKDPFAGYKKHYL